MKTWLKQLRSSLALDRDAGAGDSSGGSFGQLEARLRATQASAPVTSELHTSIMRAVRLEERGSGSGVPGFSIGRWAVAGAGALAVVAAVWLVAHSPARPGAEFAAEFQTPPVIAAAFDQGRELAVKAPEVAMAPLSDELELLHRDLTSAFNVVVASMP